MGRGWGGKRAKLTNSIGPVEKNTTEMRCLNSEHEPRGRHWLPVAISHVVMGGNRFSVAEHVGNKQALFEKSWGRVSNGREAGLCTLFSAH